MNSVNRPLVDEDVVGSKSKSGSVEWPARSLHVRLLTGYYLACWGVVCRRTAARDPPLAGELLRCSRSPPTVDI